MTKAVPLVISPPANAADYDAARDLFSEYAASLHFSLAYQGFDAELADLAAQYGPPNGALLLARAEAAAVGVVALRRRDLSICEMKRLYVQPAARGLRTATGSSLGRALAEGIIARARELGYSRIRLDTNAPRMEAAMRLYRALGFVEIEPYSPSPIPGTVFMELQL